MYSLSANDVLHVHVVHWFADALSYWFTTISNFNTLCCNWLVWNKIDVLMFGRRMH